MTGVVQSALNRGGKDEKVKLLKRFLAKCQKIFSRVRIEEILTFTVDVYVLTVAFKRWNTKHFCA